MDEKKKPLRIGIIGGMGPEAGVEFHHLVIEATPAEHDQDHLEVLCYTRPGIPDRTESLRMDGGTRFSLAVVEVARILVQAGVDLLVMPCITAHTRLTTIARQIPVPFVDIVSITAEEIALHYRTVTRVGVLATDGTIEEKIFEKALGLHGIKCITPRDEHQRLLMRTIYAVKAGRHDSNTVRTLRALMGALYERGAGCIVLACSELSLLYDELAITRVPVIDPLRLAAHHIVGRAYAENSNHTSLRSPIPATIQTDVMPTAEPTALPT